MKKSNNKFESKNWPEYYPERLKMISWCIEGKNGPIAGPMPYYTRHLDYSTKGDSLFVKQVLVSWFEKNGTPHEVCNEACQYVAKMFTVYFTDENGEFQISAKKDKETKKPLFDEKKWEQIWQGMDKKWRNACLKMMLKELKRVYDMTLGIVRK